MLFFHDFSTSLTSGMGTCCSRREHLIWPESEFLLHRVQHRVPFKRRSAVNSRACLRRFDDVTGVAKTDEVNLSVAEPERYSLK